MDIPPKLPTAKAPSETFTGDAWIDVIARGEEPSRVRVNVVRFAPGARNAWHAHAVGQTVHVVDGVGRPGSRRRDRRDPPGRHDPHPARGLALARRGARPVHDPPRHLGGAGVGAGIGVGQSGHRRGVRRPIEGGATRILTTSVANRADHDVFRPTDDVSYRSVTGDVAPSVETVTRGAAGLPQSAG